MRLPGAKKQIFELSNGRSVFIHEIRPLDVRMLYREMTEGLDGLTQKQILDTVIERENMAMFRLCEFGIDEKDAKLTEEDASKIFDYWQKLNYEFFKPIPDSPKTQKKYFRVETAREIAYNTYCGVCRLITAGHRDADFYGWSDFQDALKFAETQEKQRINELATAICCAFDQKTWEKVLKG